MNTKTDFDGLNVENFFDTIQISDLKMWEDLYQDYLTFTTSSYDISKGRNYSVDDLEKLHKMCNYNLELIAKRKNKH